MADMRYSSAGGRTRILVVDDESSVRNVLADFLKMEGYDVECAGDGVQALARLQSAHFDILLTDMEMPNMNGLELLEQVRELPNAPLAIMMTGYGTLETAIDAMKSGAWDYLLKPFQIDYLSSVVDRARSHVALTRENIDLRASEAILAASMELLEPHPTEIDYCRILLQGLQNAMGVQAAGCWIKRHVSGTPGHSWLQVAYTGEASDLHWIATDLYFTFDANRLSSSVQDATPILLDDITIRGLLNDDSQDLPDGNYMVAPLRVRSEQTGMVVMYKPAHLKFTEGQRRSAQLLCSRTASALANHNLIQTIETTFLETIRSLVNALEAKDEYTKGHSMRVSKWATMIARGMNLDDRSVTEIQTAALLHDIGKIGMDLGIINKKARLTQEEIEYLKLHPVLGKNILQPVGFLEPMLPMVLHHHERMDGRGYPYGLAGEDIPLGARVIAVADAFEVMITDRIYRNAMDLQAARDELTRCAGPQFDSTIVDVLLSIVAPYKDLEELPVKGGRKGSKDTSDASEFGLDLTGFGEQTVH